MTKLFAKVVVSLALLLLLPSAALADDLGGYAGYCTGSQCPPKPPVTVNNEYPHPICLKEYYCAGTYVQMAVANLCGCCGCNGGACGCAGGSIMCCDGTLSQACSCNFRLTE